MVHNIVVKRVDIIGEKTKPSRSLGERSSGEPQIGVAKGRFAIPDSFFEPLPDDVLKAFKGE